jgi:alkylation response protein AidB-like acyl-CoA dehydrogenase
VSPGTASDLLAGTERLVEDVVLPQVAEWDREDTLPDDVWHRMVELGLPGALVPPEYGGAGRTVSELVPVWRVLSRGWISLTGAVNPSGLAATLLLREGTSHQRERWLPLLAGGRGHAAFSITEPQAGSDLKRLETMATRVETGYRIDGRKRWVAGGVSAAVVFMLARVEDKLSCVVLPAEGRDSEAWAVEEIDKIGYRGVESAAYVFRGLVSPRAEILGGDECVGKGPRQMLGALDVGRINVACRALGVTDRALDAALRESTEREIGKGLLGDHTHVQIRIGEIRARLMAAESLVTRAAAEVDAQSFDARELATAAKVNASETAVWAVDVASRLAASRSYRADDELARLRRDAPQTQIGEGANDALLMALGRREIDAVG